MTVYCIGCGTSIDDAARTCAACGAIQPIEEPAPRLEPAPAVAVAAVPVAAPVAPPAPPAATAGESCVTCGRPLAPHMRFCGGCGTSRAEAALPPVQPPPPPRPTPAADWQSSLPAPMRSAPPELLGVCGLMTLAGILTLWPALRVLPDLFELLGSGGLGRSIGWLLLSLWTLLAFFGGACLYLAWRLTRADRVARGLSYVLLGSLAVSILFGNQHTTGLTIVMLVSLGAIAVLALAPATQTFFAAGSQGPHPDGLVIARTVVSVWAAIMLVVGLTFLPLGGLGGRFVVVGLFLLALGGVALYFNARLGEGDETARVVVSLGAAAYLILLLVLGDRSPGLLVPLAMVVGVAAYLWIPADVQQYFARHGVR